MKGKKKILLSIAAILMANMPAVMAITNTGSEYNGDVVKDIYKVFLTGTTGNDVLDQATARVETKVRTQRALPSMKTSLNPVGVYETTPTGDTATTSYQERILTMYKGMLKETFDPDEWQDIWDQFASKGNTYTNIAMNPAVMSAVFMLYKDSVGTQFAREFWSGDKSLPGDNIDGIVTQALLDAAVVDVANIGLITPANVIQVFSDMWEAVPNRFYGDPNYNLHCNTSVFKMLQLANQTAAATNNGYLSNTIQNLFLEQKIKHYSDFPANSVMGAKGTTGADSNLVFGFYALPDSELGAPRVGRVQNDSEDMFVRVNFKYGAQYREGSEIILYTGTAI